MMNKLVEQKPLCRKKMQTSDCMDSSSEDGVMPMVAREITDSTSAEGSLERYAELEEPL